MMKTTRPYFPTASLLGCAKWLCVTLVALCFAACSTTARLGENEQLYTGVKNLNYHQDSVKIDAAVKDQIFQSINVKPNNPLYSPYYRTPFPIGLWVYNHIDPKAKGFKGFLYKHLAARPVTIRRVNPGTRTEMINTLLHNNGYFTSHASYTLNTSTKNPKKASITYDVYVSEPYKIGKVEYLNELDPVSRLIDSLARQEQYLHTGNRYCLDSLNVTRINITNNLRNRGYYYYRPEYLQYLADSIREKGVIDIRLVEAPDVPNQAIQRYITGNVTAYVQSSLRTGKPDTIVDARRGITLVKLQPVHIRDEVIPRNILTRTGRTFRVGSMDRTQLALSQLGIFSNIDMQVTDRDTILPTGEGVLDLDVYTTLDKPWEVKIELQGTHKSNSYLGPGLQLGLAHKNIFGAGERLSIDLTAAYEWQTGHSGGYKNPDLNSYEIGLETSLSFPRLLAPKFIDRSRRYTNWTRFNLRGSLLNRPNFFKMLQFGGSMTWEWHANKHSLNEFTPFKLTYNKILSQTDRFNTLMWNNLALYMSLSDVFIPQMQYSYTYDNDFGANHITWKSTVSESGHIMSGIWNLCGRRNHQTLLGTPFSRFVKGETQLVWTRRLATKTSIVGRVFVGAAYSTADSLTVPYRELYYVGGANSIRAFAVRTIGPGGYHDPDLKELDFYDRMGTFKFETNWEYRFPILGYFNGAVFLDAGNIWLIKLDEYDEVFRAKGKLSLKNFFSQLAVGTGFGIRFDMDMLVIRADVGIGLHLPYETSNKGWYNIPRFKDGLAFHLAIGYPF